MSSPDVVVVGGGLVGLASAWQLGRRGISTMVVDPEPGRGASHVAAGMLAPVTEVAHGEQDLLAMHVAAAGRWPAFATALRETTGRDIGHRTTGTLQVGFDRDDATALQDLRDLQQALGLSVTPLRGTDLRDREPMLSPRVRAGLFAADDHRVEPRAVVGALLAACADHDVEMRRTMVHRLDRRGDRVVGATTTTGEQLRAGHVVLAAGAWSGAIAGLPDEHRPPVRPVKGQLLHLHDPGGSPVLGTTVRGLVRGRGVYLVPRDDGRLVVGASQEERGFDVAITAGVIRQLLDDAAAIVPGVDELEVVETIAGLRPTTPDNAPVIGVGHLDGLVFATGHHRHGVLLSPLTADAVVAIAEGSDPPAAVAVAAPGRPALSRRATTTDPRPGMDALLADNRRRGGPR